MKHERDDKHRRPLSSKPGQTPRTGGSGPRPPRGPRPFSQDKDVPAQDERRDRREGEGHTPKTPYEIVPPPRDVPAVYLKSAGFGAFIYRQMIDTVKGSPADGDIVAVVDKHGGLFGWAFYSSRSQLALRMLTHSLEQPDDSLLKRRVADAVRLRRDVLHLEEATDAYRLIHAEGDGLTGLIADRFGQYVVIELFSLAMYRRLHMIQDAIVDAGLNVRDYIVRADMHVMEHEGFSLPKLSAGKDRSTVITENGVKFLVQLSRGHKTGFFCDQRENRKALTRFTAGRDVLDLCCYTGGFACYAAAQGKATGVTAVDLDEKAIETAKQNAQLNSARIDFVHADAFEFLRQAARDGRKWPVVVLDPSKFVPRRDLMESGLQKYIDLNRMACSVVAPGGVLLTCSCSGLVDQPTFIQTVARAARYAKRELQIFRVTGAAPDHPVMADVPESGYLKAVWGRVF